MYFFNWEISKFVLEKPGTFGKKWDMLEIKKTKNKSIIYYMLHFK
jgi:hypothetical protein